jgi:hypothetical protein
MPNPTVWPAEELKLNAYAEYQAVHNSDLLGKVGING